jgi:hypothetical protein
MTRTFDEGVAMTDKYTAPQVYELGTVRELTEQDPALDKVGSSADFLTALLPSLDGRITPDS